MKNTVSRNFEVFITTHEIQDIVVALGGKVMSSAYDSNAHIFILNVNMRKTEAEVHLNPNLIIGTGYTRIMLRVNPKKTVFRL